ncbi:MAG: O-methyltransferase [Firmicutes bacterium]|nr:O-methyltransferase [Bacillota bacterium]
MLEELKAYAQDHHVPIICEDGLSLIKDSIEKYGVKHILEIGTAIGYSALAMASLGCLVDTFEKDLDMIDLAKQNIDQFDKDHQINLIPFDALDYQGELVSYDMIFIDASKAQYQRFFEKYIPYLKPSGIVICDNLRFHDLKPENVNRHTKQLLRKIESFKKYLIDHTDFQTIFFDLGDGMSISQRIRL